MKVFAKNERREIYGALFIALMFSCNSLSLLLSFIPGISAIIVVASLIGFLFVSRQSYIIGNIATIFIFVLIVILGFVRQFIFGNWCDIVQDYFLSFIFFGIPFIYVSFYKLDYRKIVLSLMIIGIVLTPVNIKDCMLEYMTLNSVDGQMVASYNILFYIVPSIIVLFGSYNIIMRLLAGIEALIGGVFLMSIGSKGAVLAFLVGIILALLYRKNEQIKIVSTKIIALILIGYLLLFNAELILSYFNDLLEKYGIVSSAIPELLEKIASGDEDQLTSGRTLIYQDALRQIYDRPVFGYGIAAFDNYSGVYPHNLFIQLLYEGGIIILISYLVLLVMFVKKMNAKFQYMEVRYFFVFLLSAGLMRLMVSYNFWESQLFWFSIGIVLKSFGSRRIISSNESI